MRAQEFENGEVEARIRVAATSVSVTLPFWLELRLSGVSMAV